jgi:Trk K+ transport system NAD-binding subunit
VTERCRSGDEIAGSGLADTDGVAPAGGVVCYDAGRASGERRLTTIVLYGLSHLGVRIAALLAGAGHRVVVAAGPGHPLRDRLPQAVEVRTGDLADEQTLAALPLGQARALVLPADDEHLNLRVALAAADLAPGLRVVVRLFDLALGARVEASLADVRVLSMSQAAAPAFAAAALLDQPLHALRVGAAVHALVERPAPGGRTVDALETSLGGVVVAAGEVALPGPAHVPAAGEPLVVAGPLAASLALAPPAVPSSTTGAPRAASPSAPRRVVRRLRADPVLRHTLATLLAVVALAVAWFVAVERLSPLDAFYFVITTLTTTGYGDISLRDAGWASKLVDVGLMLAGVTLSAVLFAMVTDGLLAKRRDLRLGRHRLRARGHVVICGAGDVGLRIARELVAQGVEVVAIERSGEHRHLEALRADGIHFAVADATREETLVNAGVEAARAVVCATDDDLRNLEIGLAVRRLAPTRRVVLRIFDRDFARRVERRFDIQVALSGSELAAPAFAAAALGEPTGVEVVRGQVRLRVRVAAAAPGLDALVAQGRARILARAGQEVAWVERADDQVSLHRSRHA